MATCQGVWVLLRAGTFMRAHPAIEPKERVLLLVLEQEARLCAENPVHIMPVHAVVARDCRARCTGEQRPPRGADPLLQRRPIRVQCSGLK